VRLSNRSVSLQYNRAIQIPSGMPIVVPLKCAKVVRTDEMTLKSAISEIAKTAERRCFRRSLLRWFDLHKRNLPWRQDRDPYRVWLSEIMLQQTRVNAVTDYYEQFLRRFPTIETLASAPESAVLAAWSGSGIIGAPACCTRRRNKLCVNIRRTSEDCRRFTRSTGNRPLHGGRDCQHRFQSTRRGG